MGERKYLQVAECGCKMPKATWVYGIDDSECLLKLRGDEPLTPEAERKVHRLWLWKQAHLSTEPDKALI